MSTSVREPGLIWRLGMFIAPNSLVGVKPKAGWLPLIDWSPRSWTKSLIVLPDECFGSWTMALPIEESAASSDCKAVTQRLRWSTAQSTPVGSIKSRFTSPSSSERSSPRTIFRTWKRSRIAWNVSSATTKALLNPSSGNLPETTSMNSCNVYSQVHYFQLLLQPENTLVDLGNGQLT